MILAQAVEHAEHGNIWTEYTELVTDPAHLMLEITLILVIDVLLIGLAWPLIKRAIRRHDAEHHPDDFYGDDQYDDDYDDWDMYYDEEAEEQYADHLLHQAAGDEYAKTYEPRRGGTWEGVPYDHYVDYIYKDGEIVQAIEYKDGKRVEYDAEDLNGY